MKPKIKLLVAALAVISMIGEFPSSKNEKIIPINEHVYLKEEMLSKKTTSENVNLFFLNKEQMVGRILNVNLPEFAYSSNFESYVSVSESLIVAPINISLITYKIPPSFTNVLNNNEAALDSQNMATHGKMFWWGYQIYFNHEIMAEIAAYMVIGGAASGGLSAIIGALAAEAGVAVAVLCAFVFTNFAIMQIFDKGGSVTLTKETWGPGVYWFNSGNCIQGE